MNRTLVFAALVGACLVPAAVRAAIDAPVRLDTGLISGASGRSPDVRVFKGVPFAAPPVGPLRWRAPQPVKPWSGVREATTYQADCMQVPFPSDAAPLGTKPAEDCLYINIWKPAAAAAGKLPVLVWI